jgi:hypothetical protein
MINDESFKYNPLNTNNLHQNHSSFIIHHSLVPTFGKEFAVSKKAFSFARFRYYLT